MGQYTFSVTICDNVYGVSQMHRRRLVVSHVRSHVGKENIAFVPRIQIPVETVPRQVASGQHRHPKSAMGKKESARVPVLVGEGSKQ